MFNMIFQIAFEKIKLKIFYLNLLSSNINYSYSLSIRLILFALIANCDKKQRNLFIYYKLIYNLY